MTIASPNNSASDVRLVAIDLDGTLLRDDKSVSERSVAAIAEASRRGVEVVLASARPPRGVIDLWALLGLDTPSVHYNGALIVDLADGRPLFHRPLAKGVAAKAVALARAIEPSVVVQVETRDRWLTDRVDRSFFVATNVGSDPDFVGPVEACLADDPTKVMLLAEPARLRPVRDAVERQLAGELGVQVSDDHVIQLVHREVDKAAALRWLCEREGIAAEAVVAVGDAPNDVAMLRWAGRGVAVANAWPEVKAAADAVVASNEDDGVAEAIGRHVLGEPASAGSFEERPTD